MTGSRKAVITAKQCDVTIVVLGLDELMEGEEPDQSNRGQAGDKASLEFPGCQQRLLEAVVAVGKSVITVVLNPEQPWIFGMRMPIRMPSYRHGIREQRGELMWRMSFLASIAERQTAGDLL